MDQSFDQEKNIRELNDHIKQLESKIIELTEIVNQNIKDTNEFNEERELQMVMLIMQRRFLQNWE
ncbi:hypothetical protein H312_01811 [Anncaliia algerae PRA339]|uniref:Uncharacterized protein n=1 Tax=Anncaliia algerae PRA339 TaxID=1288291 RepID=A0A059F0C4_9MICR|nr:hypothetical protein H312_01811 [Anncaliia algerae PRA339]